MKTRVILEKGRETQRRGSRDRKKQRGQQTPRKAQREKQTDRVGPRLGLGEAGEQGLGEGQGTSPV